MSWPQYCGAPGFCIPDGADLIALGVSLLAWGFIYLLKWLDPARKAVEQITGKPWWRN